ncbi:MAG: hypothetical protein EOP84_34695 [Verrucomicrobiaceae bacterium]|nr:MAG: hypothetical protein EOP84_34695 [Verrucomicrobiaceae bacterium]
MKTFTDLKIPIPSLCHASENPSGAMAKPPFRDRPTNADVSVEIPPQTADINSAFPYDINSARNSYWLGFLCKTLSFSISSRFIPALSHSLFLAG